MSISDIQLAHESISSKNGRASRGRTVDDLDLGVSSRQAFGRTYARPQGLEEALSAYRAGKLALPPHPVWEGNFTDWTANPFTDKNWQFQHHTLRWLNPLRWAGLEGDEDSRNEWIRVVRSWADANVPANKSKSAYAWKDMADGNRAIQLSLGAPLVSSDDTWFVELLEYHKIWLMDESHIVGKNHGLHQHVGLLVVGSTLQDAEAVELAVSRMKTQFKTTFDAQGSNDEGSSSYHQLNMTWWRRAWDRGRAEGIEPPSDVNKRFSLAATVLAHMAMPNGQLPQIGDAARGRVTLGHSEITDFVSSSGSKGRRPREKTLILDRGLILSRSGWGVDRPLKDESHTLIRFGEEMRSHSHRDRGSVHVYSAGQRWLVDSGFHSYAAAAPENKYLVSRDAHNVASVVGHQHNGDALVELVSSNVGEAFHDFTLRDHGYTGITLTRRVLYFLEADCWIVSDRAISEDPIEITQRWNVEPDISSRVLDHGFNLSGENGSFGMHWLGRGTRLSRTIPDEKSFAGWIGTKWKTLTPGIRLTAKSTSSRPHLVALFGPHSPHPLGVVESRVSATGRISFHVARGPRHWKISIHEDDVRIK